MRNTNIRFIKKAINSLHKLQKEALIEFSKDLLLEKYSLLKIVNNIPVGIVLLINNKNMFENDIFAQLLKEIPNLQFFLDIEGIKSIKDLYKKNRIFDIKKYTIDVYDIIYITDITKYINDTTGSETQKSFTALEKLAAGISHEIKNPLSAIDIHTQILQNKINKQKIKVPEEIVQYLDIVQHESHRLLNILDIFLNSTRKSIPNLEFTEISQIIQKIANLLKAELDKENISLNLQLNTVPKIFTSPFIIQQIILDLVRNSIESFTIANDNKQIKISITESDTKNHIIISIEDSGIGIPKELYHKIFDPYFTTKNSGTGLGLTMVKKMVEELSGNISIEDSELGGTKVELYFPISQEQKKLLS